MGFYVAQGGSSLQVVERDGDIAETLTLPTGVTLDSTARARFAILGQELFLVNSPLVNLWIDPIDFTVRPMNLRPPVSAPYLAAGAGAGLTGAYRRKCSFAVKGVDGEIRNESPLSPASLSVDLTDDDLKSSFIPTSVDSEVNCRRLYRTVAGGEVYFHELDIDDNETLEVTSSLPDAALSLLPADPTLGNPPGTYPGSSLKLMVPWNNRLFGVSGAYQERDRLYYTEDGLFYAWANHFAIPPLGRDTFGITGLIPRRDELGICKRNLVAKLVGDSDEDFEIIVVAEGAGVGCVAPDSVVVIRDVGYFLGPDGVYTFGPDGVMSISRDKVDPWFTTGTTFNRGEFENAIGGYNPTTDCYELHLAAAGQSTLNRWISYDIRRGEWLGPHLTTALTPTQRALVLDANEQYLALVGGTGGHLWKMNQSGKADGGDTAIAIDWLTKLFSGGAPDIYHHWGQAALLLAAQASGTLTVTPTLGDIGASAGTSQSVALTKARARLARFGDGHLLQLRLQHGTTTEEVKLYGLEIPYTEVGRR